MFQESPWSRKSIGDVDVVFHDGLYHLFHLVLPNHDFIAHAISDNALNWRRVDNALYIGEPGSWDDLMLWTMHVAPDPHKPGRWRMFYTGISRRDQGRKQRVGMACSEDLFHWSKAPIDWQDRRGNNDPERVKAARAQLPRSVSDAIKAERDPTSCFPLEPDPRFYEHDRDNERKWVSFRDPFYFRDGERGWLAIAARVNDGPLVRRGCVALAEEVSPNHFQQSEPIFCPMLYDDIEVPNLFRIEGECYLIGSLREDANIRYWHTEEIGQPWRSYYDNILLPRGNYAARICPDEKGFLLWNFFTKDKQRRSDNLLPPPKRLQRCPNGQLRLVTFEGLWERIIGNLNTRCVRPLKDERKETRCAVGDGSLQLVSEAGFQAYVFEEEIDCFRMRCRLSMTGIGKCGILCRVDPRSHDGYYLALDMVKGLAELRSWGAAEEMTGEDMLQFYSLQTGYWPAASLEHLDVQLVAFGSYLELSINGSIVLSLADSAYSSGLLGIYVETSELQVQDLSVHHLKSPTQSDEHLTNG